MSLVTQVLVGMYILRCFYAMTIFVLLLYIDETNSKNNNKEPRKSAPFSD